VISFVVLFYDCPDIKALTRQRTSAKAELAFGIFGKRFGFAIGNVFGKEGKL